MVSLTNLALFEFFIQTPDPSDSLKVSRRWGCCRWCRIQQSTAPNEVQNHTATTVTPEIPADLAWILKGACVDSASIWYQHWCEITEGKRTDLSADGALSLSRKAWELWKILDSQGV